MTANTSSRASESWHDDVKVVTCAADGKCLMDVGVDNRMDR